MEEASEHTHGHEDVFWPPIEDLNTAACSWYPPSTTIHTISFFDEVMNPGYKEFLMDKLRHLNNKKKNTRDL